MLFLKECVKNLYVAENAKLVVFLRLINSESRYKQYNLYQINHDISNIESTEMHITNFEFKAKVGNLENYEQKLLTLSPVFRGTDHQVDTYFLVQNRRLKLREGNIENALISYNREDVSGAKQSGIILFKYEPGNALKNILLQHLEVKVVVNKKRKIYFIDNVKFHFDIVEGLGSFLEVEAIDDSNQFTIDELKQQCDKYFQFFNLTSTNLVAKSYSDLLLEKELL